MTSKTILIIAIAIILLAPVNVYSISVNQIEDKLKRELSQATSVEEIENILLEYVKTDEYGQACKKLKNQLLEIGEIKTEQDAEKALPLMQDYESIQCRYTALIWDDPPKQYSTTQCSELLEEFEDYNKKYWDIEREIKTISYTESQKVSEEFKNTSEWWYLRDLKNEVSGEFRSFCIPRPDECNEMKLEYNIINEKWIELDQKFPEKELEKQLVQLDLLEKRENFEIRCDFKNNVVAWYESREEYFDEPIPTTLPASKIECGLGTVENSFGQCVPESSNSSKGGGCLIATATYGSELAPQVQQLRELRDNHLLQTQSGQFFMNTFNDFYYTFSPIIADYERENPLFKEAVKLAITPMISSLSILNHVGMSSDQEVLGYGIILILLNVGMYFVAPAVVIVAIRKKF